ncbi:Uncharacterised protein [Vibrio cholerae]|nr:Uncharacterised protein [Vibrio cholerae]
MLNQPRRVKMPYRVCAPKIGRVGSAAFVWDDDLAANGASYVVHQSLAVPALQVTPPTLKRFARPTHLSDRRSAASQQSAAQRPANVPLYRPL